MSSSFVLEWLLDPVNPGVRLRALTDLCGLAPNAPAVQDARAQALVWLPAARSLGWLELKGLAATYNLTALAECGLTRADLPLDNLATCLLAAPFDAGCGDYLLLRALVMLGYAGDALVQERLALAAQTQLPDGGWLCLHRLNKLKETPKSCIKAACHALLLAGELAKRGMPQPWGAELSAYFQRRRLFYRTDNPAQLVLSYRPGWRMTDIFMPAEVQRVGLPQLLEALSALGVGSAPEFADAWALLESAKDSLGRLVLQGTQSKPYLPREAVGKPSRWATLYAALAEREW